MKNFEKFTDYQIESAALDLLDDLLDIDSWVHDEDVRDNMIDWRKFKHWTAKQSDSYNAMSKEDKKAVNGLYSGRVVDFAVDLVEQLKREKDYEHQMQEEMNVQSLQEMIALEGESYLYGEC